jgi:hypothetical protein
LPTEKDGTCGLSSAPGEKIKFFFLNIFWLPRNTVDRLKWKNDLADPKPNLHLAFT